MPIVVDHINSPEKKKEATTNSIDKNDNKCFQYAARLELNHKGIAKHPISQIKPFMDKCNYVGINYAWGKDDWEKFEKTF